MKLLIVTQTIDREDPVLGFFHRWVEEFATHFEHIEVICLKEGTHTLPKNVTVHSLGKERGAASRVAYSMRFLKLLWQLRSHYDAVFVHMNPEYVLLGGLLWRLSGKRVCLWYTHKSTPWYLRLSLPLANVVTTASPESFRLKSKKLIVTGHGIDVGDYVRRNDRALRMVSVGRISRAKRPDVLIEAFEIIKRKHPEASFSLIGGAITADDIQFQEELERSLKKNNLNSKDIFVGVQTHDKIPTYLSRTDYFLHASETGSLDKAVLEAAAHGVIPLTSSEAYAELFGTYAKLLMYPHGNHQALAERVVYIHGMSLTERESIRAHLHSSVGRAHGLESLIRRLITILQGRPNYGREN